jgi:hypothetical protein
MARKHNTKHPARGQSTYSKRDKAASADQYGEFREGRRVSADRIVKWTQPGESSN